jgi:3-phenylpropionate/trans-cinnamate dioxygenase ferredoxin reductase subunit
LSKDLLQGKQPDVFVHAEQWYADYDVELRLNVSAVDLSCDDHLVTLSDGEQVSFDKLAITTGSSPRRLDIAGADLEGVHYLRTLGDAGRILAGFESGGRVVIVGGGWIGLEVAAAARARNLNVTVLEMAELPLVGVLGPRMAQVFADLHRANGVDLRVNARVDGFVGGPRVTGVQSGAEIIGADMVIVGVGVTPNTALAQAGDLRLDNGIVTDEHLRTSDPDVYAAGDVANAFHPRLGRHIRVEHWANALNQPQVVAANMLGDQASYDRIPYFYSDQYDLGMEYVGYVGRDMETEVVVRGDEASREFVAFWLSAGRVVAGMNVNIWDVVDPIRELILSGRQVEPARLADPDVPLDQI